MGDKAKIGGGVLFLLVIFFLPHLAFSAVDTEALLKRLDELSAIIQQQQKEIDLLRRELQSQNKRPHEVRENRAGDIQKAESKVKEDEVQEEVSKTKSSEAKTDEWKDTIPGWVSRIKLYGDLRLRYERLFNREVQEPDFSTTDIPSRDRFRLRARLFFDGAITDEISTQFMICTNQDSNQEATTTNQSFTDDFNDKGIYLHRAYASYKPKWLKGLELTGGKFKNTFLHTDIMWDPDVNPEGIYERYTYRGWEDFQPFIHLGQMVVNEENLQTNDARLYINQAGFQWKIGPVRWTMAGSYYKWANLENSEFLHNAEYKNGGGNTFVVDDNGVLQYAYDYDLWEAISFISFVMKDVPTKLIFDYIVNTADDVPSGQDTAWFAGFELGNRKNRGDWSFFYKYARIEKDALIGSMNDQDFYGANRKGHKIKFSYMLYDRLQLATAFFYTDPIVSWDPNAPTFNTDRSRMHEDRLQVDLIFVF